jgi:ElaA protein
VDDPTWTCLPFAELSLDRLYALLRLRQVVFVVEQDCPYVDADGIDQDCWHLWTEDRQGAVLAYARLVPPGVLGSEARIGRVITAAAARRTGLGRVLMRRAISEVEARWPGPILVAAQEYLLDFYRGLGFDQPSGEPYLEDGIPHQDLVRPSA